MSRTNKKKGNLQEKPKSSFPKIENKSSKNVVSVSCTVASATSSSGIQGNGSHGSTGTDKPIVLPVIKLSCNSQDEQENTAKIDSEMVVDISIATAADLCISHTLHDETSSEANGASNDNSSMPKATPTIVPVEEGEVSQVQVEIHNNGSVKLLYVMYDEEFSIKQGSLTQAVEDGHTFEEIYVAEGPSGTFHGLIDGKSYYVYVEEEAQQLLRDQLRTKQAAESLKQQQQKDVGGSVSVVRDDGRSGLDSCTCIYGTPCLDEYGCRNWSQRFMIAQQNGW
eukprot:CAMPEP_0174956132 /NCGR_PEP_ID=MMETSP0004_2-20121128/1360_1 /TAXON_ID=420556 /ORGANISM="Ochromonas sp., Strain CCMP1393" /LENGTH=280 /DNA_ID=CAMNT_0016204123 /DNA_START=70 /DNA_END=909 /DNA_ORIENTATION=-